MSVINGVVVAVPPPDGYVVDFDHPQRNSVTTVYAVSGIGMFFAFLFVLQRLYVKIAIRNKLGYDDGLLLVAWLGSIAIQVLTIRSFAVGFEGVHSWEIPIDLFQEAVLFATYINSIVYTVPVCFSKVVILLFLREINHNQQWYRWSIYGAMFVVIGSSTGILFSSLFSCHPFRKNYDITFPTDEGSCIDRAAMFQATAALGVATDVLIILIPVPMVVGLRISRSKKIGLMLLFIVGSVTVITSMVRLGLLVSALDSIDTTWGGGPIHVWICVEANLLVVCACLSTVRHFVRTVAPWVLSSSRGTSKTPASNPTYELRSMGASGGSQFERLEDRYGVEAQVRGGRHSLSTKTSAVDDEGSDKGIMQTTTTQVTYATAH